MQKFLLCGKVTTKFAPKTKSYIHSTWNSNHHKNGKKRTIFFLQRRYILKHKRKRHNLKGPRAARSCLVTSKKGLYSWPTTCWVVEFHNLFLVKDHHRSPQFDQFRGKKSCAYQGRRRGNGGDSKRSNCWRSWLKKSTKRIVSYQLPTF